jgi:hypothetical protein
VCKDAAQRSGVGVRCHAESLRTTAVPVLQPLPLGAAGAAETRSALTGRRCGSAVEGEGKERGGEREEEGEGEGLRQPGPGEQKLFPIWTTMQNPLMIRGETEISSEHQSCCPGCDPRRRHEEGIHHRYWMFVLVGIKFI